MKKKRLRGLLAFLCGAALILWGVSLLWTIPDTMIYVIDAPIVTANGGELGKVCAQAQAHLDEVTALNETQRGNADVDKNEVLNSKDALLILQFSNGSSEKIGTPATANKNTEAPTEPVSTQSKPSGGNQTEPASQEAAVTEKEYERSGVSDDAAYFSTDKNIYFTARITNKWKDASGKNMYQIEVKIKNNSAKSMYNTSAYISFSSPAEVGKAWSCSTKSGSQAIKITTNNESTLYSGGTFGCGFTVSSDSSDLKISYFAKERPSSETTSQ